LEKDKKITMKKNIRILFLVSIFLLAAISATNAKTIYVDADRPPGGDGLSWLTAFKYLQDGLTDADGSIKPVEIRVAQGTYKPDQGNGVTLGDQFATFQLINEVTIKGGYAGHSEFDPNKRNIANNLTTLSGDLMNNDVAVIDPRDLLTEPTFTDNSYNIVTGSGTDETAILDGFTIRAGGYIDGNGGGIYNSGGSPKLIDCTFTRNRAGRYGGGMYNANGDPILINCMFEGNVTVESGGGMYNQGDPTLTNCVFQGNFATSSLFGGGGFYNHFFCYPILTNCKFYGNVTAANGGGMYDWYGYPVLTNCTFAGNSAETGGGGIYNHHTGLTLTNSIFSDNSANQGGAMYNYFVYDNELRVKNCLFIGNLANYGGGMFVNYCTAQTLTNCTFVTNSALDGNALAFDSSNNSSNLQATNCIFWDGEYGIWINDESTVTMNYSDFQGGWWGDGSNNIDADPRFVCGRLGDYYLSQTAAGQETNSLCLDAGSDTAVNLGLDTFTTRTNQVVDVGTVDMGYHYPITNVADINGDWLVDFIDYAILASQWQQAPGIPSADIEPACGDGTVNFLDLCLLVDNWLWKQ
jgi:hypothetical protein